MPSRPLRSSLVHHHPNRRQTLATLRRPAQARKRSARAIAAVLDRRALRPRPIAPLDDFRDRPALGRGFAAEHVLDDHGGRESRGDVEDLEVEDLARVLVLPDFGGLVEDVQLGVLGGEHVVHARAGVRGLVGGGFRRVGGAGFAGGC